MGGLDFRFTTSFNFDHNRNCLVVFPEFQDRAPTPLYPRYELFARAVREGHVSDNLLEAMFDPILVPKTDLASRKTGVTVQPVVMCPAPGHKRTVYDFSSGDDISIFMLNQAVASSWELVRQTLQDIGANVIVAGGLLRDNAGPAQFVFPVHDVFARDPGFVFNGNLYSPSSYAWAEVTSAFFADVSSPLRGKGRSSAQAFLNGVIEKVGEEKRQHSCNVRHAFKEAGTDIALRWVDICFEGGDIIADQGRGIIFVGKSLDCGSRGYDLISSRVPEVLRTATGAEVVAIERWGGIYRSDEDYKTPKEQRYHLDTFMSLLPGGEMLIDPRYTTAKSLGTIKRIYGDNIVYVGEENPENVPGFISGTIPNYVPNLVAVGRTLFMPSCSQNLSEELKKRDYNVVSSADLGVQPCRFYMSGGGIHCVTHTMPT